MVESNALYVSVEDICMRNMRGVVLDVFFLIHNFTKSQEAIFKSEMFRVFAEQNQDSDQKGLKYRFIIDSAVAKLEGMMLIDSYKDGNIDKYFLTDVGKEAVSITTRLMSEDPTMLYGCKIMNKMMKTKED